MQSYIDDCSANGGGNIVFNKGEYVLSTVFLKSNVNIVLEEGAVLLGAPSFYDYCFHEKIDYPLYQDESHSFFHCSMFVGIDCENISITGKGKIDMRSVWDEDNVRNIVHRGAKCIALKECKNVAIKGVTVNNCTDLAIYFAGCENVEISGIKMRTYIDGISPDNSKNVKIYDCDIETGDDGIVFKSSFTLNRIDYCKNIRVWNCKIKSRCNAIKFGTETNGGFDNIDVRDIRINDTRLCGICIESVDGAVITNVRISNVYMKNVATPLFIFLGDRMRAPAGTPVGRISDITIENVTAEGPYVPYEIIPMNYWSFIAKSEIQYPWMGVLSFTPEEIEKNKDNYWQTTSNVMGLDGNSVKNLTLKNILFTLQGGCKEYIREVPQNTSDYPEIDVNGKALPAKGIFFRNVDGLVLDNVKIKTYLEDARKDDFVFENVKNCKVIRS
ncbi:MAG: right-handed parallel beta-helix repeat-containing protein [Clostridia bacterium]|nr:right-handed parallel beta-helix repeat-containing protein [Clostridia bacterium]